MFVPSDHKNGNSAFKNDENESDDDDFDLDSAIASSTISGGNVFDVLNEISWKTQASTKEGTKNSIIRGMEVISLDEGEESEQNEEVFFNFCDIHKQKLIIFTKKSLIKYYVNYIIGNKKKIDNLATQLKNGSFHLLDCWRHDNCPINYKFGIVMIVSNS
jgi:hypothetical protein